MTDFKDITSFLLNGNVHLAEETLNNIVNYKLMENSLANVSGYLKSNKNDILKTLEYSNYRNLWTDAVVNNNTDEALSVFTNFVANEVGVNPRLFKTWQLNKEFIDWYNVNIAAKVDLPPVPPSNTFWTKFDPDGLGTEYQDDIHGTSARSNGVTSGHRENEFGKVGDADSVGNVSPEVGDAISKASDKTDVRNRDMGSDVSLTKDVDANDVTKSLRSQNVGDNPIQRKIDDQPMVSKQHKKDTLQGRPGNGTQGYNDRSKTGKQAPKYSPKNNNKTGQEQVMRMRAAKNDPSVPEWATRTQPNFNDWEKENGTYQPK